MSKRRVSVGDVALIPVADVFVPAKVLYLSRYFKNLILLGIYNLRQKEKKMPSELPDTFAEAVYTSQQLILNDRWPYVGNEALRPKQKGLSKRIVGGDVWLEDEPLRSASARDYRSLPQMEALGSELVEEMAANIVGY